MGAGPRCRQHRAPAGWRCGGCAALLCPDCAAVQRTAHVELVVCPACRAPAELLSRHREQEAPFLARVPSAFLFPIRGDAAVALVSLAVFLMLTRYVGGVAHAVGTCAVWATAFAVLRATSVGKDTVDLGEDGSWLGLAAAGFKASLVWLTLGGTALLYVFFVRSPPAEVLDLLADPVLWGLLVLGIAWGPMSTIMAATHCSVPRLLNPVLAFAYVAKLGFDYWAALLVLALLTASAAGLGLVARAVDLALPLPFVGKLLGGLVDGYFAFVSAAVLGQLLYVRGDRLGYGLSSDYQVPLLGDAQPRAVLPDAGTALPAAAYGIANAQAFDAAMAQGPGAEVGGARVQPLELSEEEAPGEVPLAVQPPLPRPAPETLDAGALAPKDDFFARGVKDAVEHGDWPNAVAAWRHGGPQSGALLTVDQLCGLGRAAAGAGEDAVARQALELAAAGDAWDAPRARARALLARVLDERFHEGAAAQALYRRVLERAPGTEAAAFAQSMLRKGG